MKIPVNGREDLRRDSRTGAILSHDKSKLIEAKRKKQEQDRYINLEKRVKQLEFLVQSLIKGPNQ